MVIGADGRHNALLPQHCFPGMPSEEWNGIVHAVRRDLHWPRARLLLIAVTKPDPLGTGGLDRLDVDLVGVIFHHMLHGAKDTRGYEVAGSYALPFELRPMLE